MIPNEIINRIREAANNDLVRIIRSLCPSISLQRQGISYKACCPFHSERTPSFVVTPARHRWQCFGGCGVGGDAVAFVMKLNGCSFIDAIRTLAPLVHIYLPTSGDQKRPEIDKTRIVSLHQFVYRPLSISDLAFCGINESIDEGRICTISLKLQLFALRSYTLPAKRGATYSWRISERAGYPLLLFCYQNPDKTEWGVIYQPEAPVGKRLQNFGIQKDGTVFYNEAVRDFIHKLRAGQTDDKVDIKGLV